MASIEQRASGSWSVYWRNQGRVGKQRVTVGPDAEKLALRILDLVNARQNKITKSEVERFFGLIVEVDEDGDVHRATPTVDELATHWLESRTKLGGRQRRDYRSKLDRIILPGLRPLTADLVRGSHIAKILNRLSATPLANTTVDRYYIVMQSMFGFAISEGHITRNPVLDTDWVLGQVADDDVDEDDDGHVYLTREQFRAFRTGFSGIHGALVDYLAATGSRWSEATALQRRDLNLTAAEPYVYIRRAWKQDEHQRWFIGVTKGRKKRKAYIGPNLAAQLAALKVGEAPEALVFTAPRGGRIWINNFREFHWNRAAAVMRRCDEHPPPQPVPNRHGRRRTLSGDVSTCGCPGLWPAVPTPHDLRHSWTAWQIAAGRPLVAISKALGHASTEVTEKVYAGILPEVRQSLAEVGDDIIAPDEAA